MEEILRARLLKEEEKLEKLLFGPGGPSLAECTEQWGRVKVLREMIKEYDDVRNKEIEEQFQSWNSCV